MPEPTGNALPPLHQDITDGLYIEAPHLVADPAQLERDLVDLERHGDLIEKRYIPQVGEVVTEDDFIGRGVRLVEIIRTASWLIGRLLDWKFQQENAKDDKSRSAIIARYAPLWSVSETSLWRAWVTSCKFAEITRPEELRPTTQYEILSGTDDKAEAETLFERAVDERWSVTDVREMKMIREKGLADDWQRITLRIDDAGKIWADAGAEAKLIGTLFVLKEDRLVRAGIEVMLARARTKPKR